ncbi:MAG: hypothetical protein INR64_00065 [Caulobacteraceae bacterium]|nr:hypothetical protein [Caulobacter sp.]
MARLGWTLGAVAGSLAGGAVVSALMLAQERASRKPAELTTLQRATAQRMGRRTLPPTAPYLPTPEEQATAHGGHMLLSAAAGVAYAAAFDEDAPLVLSGLGFGEAFYALAHGVLKPILSTEDPEWRQPPPAIAQHLLVHAVFGLFIAAGAKLGAALDRRALAP